MSAFLAPLIHLESGECVPLTSGKSGPPAALSFKYTIPDNEVVLLRGNSDIIVREDPIYGVHIVKRHKLGDLFGAITEACIMRILPQHPYIQDVHHCKITPDAVELLQPKQLTCTNKIIAANIRPNRETLDRWCFQALLAMHHLHSHNIVHGDIKPDNWLITADGDLKLTDFELAMALLPKHRRKGLAYTTPFRPPEIFNDQAWNHSADIWALGLTFYTWAHGDYLIDHCSESHALDAINYWGFHGPHKELAQECKYETEFLKPLTQFPRTKIYRIITSMLRYDPSKRPTASQLLQHYFDFMPEAPYPPLSLSMLTTKGVSDRLTQLIVWLHDQLSPFMINEELMDLSAWTILFAYKLIDCQTPEDVHPLFWMLFPI